MQDPTGGLPVCSGRFPHIMGTVSPCCLPVKFLGCTIHPPPLPPLPPPPRLSAAGNKSAIRKIAYHLRLPGTAQTVAEGGLKKECSLSCLQMAEQAGPRTEADALMESGQPTEASDALTLEDGENARATICLDFTKNKCNRGAACKFTHDVEVIARINAREEGVCYDWQRGMCARGKLCRFSHDPEKLAKQEAKQATKQQVTGFSIRVQMPSAQAGSGPVASGVH